MKDGSAKSVIEGLSRSGDNYSEAVECLQARFDRPCLIHQTHVRMISEVPALRDGTGKELRRLHDTAQQHLRALKAMGHEPPGPFITSRLELKLDSNTMFEWQRHSQESTDVPHFSKLLESQRYLSLVTKGLLEVGTLTESGNTPLDQLPHSLLTRRILPQIVLCVEQANIHSMPVQSSSPFLMTRCPH